MKHWPSLDRQLRLTRHVALFTDFDGTLVPIQAQPGTVHLAPPVRKLLAELAGKVAILGIVSGRRLSDVRSRVALAGIWYVGAHGYFLRQPGGQTASLLEPGTIRQMRQLSRFLRRQLVGVSGILVEPKEATVAIHYRHASSESRARARQLIRSLLAQSPHLHLLAGKKVWELLPDSRINKLTAIQHILQEERRRGGRWMVFYLGDDTTDEKVFEKLRGISVVVGKRRRTAARFRLRSPAEVHLFLTKLCEAIP